MPARAGARGRAPGRDRGEARRARVRSASRIASSDSPRAGFGRPRRRPRGAARRAEGARRAQPRRGEAPLRRRGRVVRVREAGAARRASDGIDERRDLGAADLDVAADEAAAATAGYLAQALRGEARSAGRAGTRPTRRGHGGSSRGSRVALARGGGRRRREATKRTAHAATPTTPTTPTTTRLPLPRLPGGTARSRTSRTPPRRARPPERAPRVSLCSPPPSRPRPRGGGGPTSLRRFFRSFRRRVAPPRGFVAPSVAAPLGPASPRPADVTALRCSARWRRERPRGATTRWRGRRGGGVGTGAVFARVPSLEAAAASGTAPGRPASPFSRLPLRTQVEAIAPQAPPALAADPPRGGGGGDGAGRGRRSRRFAGARASVGGGGRERGAAPLALTSFLVALPRRRRAGRTRARRRPRRRAPRGLGDAWAGARSPPRRRSRRSTRRPRRVARRTPTFVAEAGRTDRKSGKNPEKLERDDPSEDAPASDRRSGGGCSK